MVQGLMGLVDNPLAQPLLKLVLPRLGPLLHDPALKVRLALADLLLTVMYANLTTHFLEHCLRDEAQRWGGVWRTPRPMSLALEVQSGCSQDPGPNSKETHPQSCVSR